MYQSPGAAFWGWQEAVQPHFWPACPVAESHWANYRRISTPVTSIR
jgi:hypothetical protein